jgi:hypothetical protein
VVLMNGRWLADAQFPATAARYRALLEWMRGFGRLHVVGVEGTGSYGLAHPETVTTSAKDLTKAA